LIETIEVNASFIQIDNKHVAIVDKEDYPNLIGKSWRAESMHGKDNHYAVTTKYLGKINGKKRQTTQRMHRLIMEPSKEVQIDHINHNGLDNRKENIRIVTCRQNNQNKINKGSSKYPGVSWEKSRQKWKAGIEINGHHRFLGHFTNERDAAKAYERACRSLGEELVCKT